MKEYPKTEDGSIDWVKLIPNKYFIPFEEKKDMLEKKYKMKYSQIKKGLQSGELELEDNEKLVLLAGWRHLAKERGYKSVTYPHFVAQTDFVSAVCRIVWLPMEEGEEEIVYEDGADSSHYNTYSFTKNFLTTMTMNRAFCRAVRSFLNIQVLGYDELGETKAPPSTAVRKQEVNPASVYGPHKTLEKIASDELGCGSFEEFKTLMRNDYKSGSDGEGFIKKDEAEGWADYEDYEDIPSNIIARMIKRIKDRKK